MPILSFTQLPNTLAQYYKKKRIHLVTIDSEFRTITVEVEGVIERWAQTFLEGWKLIYQGEPNPKMHDGDTLRYCTTLIVQHELHARTLNEARGLAAEHWSGVLEPVRGQIEEDTQKVNVHLVGKPVQKTRKMLNTIGVFPPEDVVPFVGMKSKTYTVGGVDYETSLNSARLFFIKDRRSCVVCGTEGTEFRLMKNFRQPDSPCFFHLYGRDELDRWRLITVDHIVARGRGGPDHPDNWQTMCDRCNGVKKDHHLDVEQVRQLIREKGSHVEEEGSGAGAGRPDPLRAGEVLDCCGAGDQVQGLQGQGDL